MKAVARNLHNWPLTVAILGGVGLVISFLAPVFTTSVRWFLLGAVLAAVALRRRSFAWVRSAPGISIVLCVTWGVLTTAWSQEPTLSFMKSAAFALVTGALISAGYQWVRSNPLREALTFLFPLAIAAILAGVLGKTSATAYVAGPGIVLYRGLTGNSNMLGSLMFMVVPLMLWKVHVSSGRWRAMWCVMLLIGLAVLVLSVARSSILATLILVATYGMSLALARRAAILFFGSLIAATFVLMTPATLDRLEARYVRKSTNTNMQQPSVMYSRQGPWEVSLEMARRGGIIGAGYGVSIGGGHFAGGLTAFGYGREKGNSQLAIVEETGIVGLFLYALIVITLVDRLWRAFRSSTDRTLRVLIGIVLGAIVGELVLGVFEAWWVAPGAPESIWFWTMVGVAIALSEAVLRKPVAHTAVTTRSARFAAVGPHP